MKGIVFLLCCSRRQFSCCRWPFTLIGKIPHANHTPFFCLNFSSIFLYHSDSLSSLTLYTLLPPTLRQTTWLSFYNNQIKFFNRLLNPSPLDAVPSKAIHFNFTYESVIIRRNFLPFKGFIFCRFFLCSSSTFAFILMARRFNFIPLNLYYPTSSSLYL